MNSRPPKFRRLALSIAAASLAASSLYSADSTWTGTTSTTWATTTNWSPNTLPSAAIGAVFTSPFTNQPVIAATTNVFGILVTGASHTTGASGLTTIGGAATLTVSGTETINGFANAGILLDGAGNNNLTISTDSLNTRADTSYLVNNSGTLTIGSGTSSMAGGHVITFGGTSSTGVIVINSRMTATGGGMVVDTAGTVTYNGGSVASNYTLGLTLNNGTLNINKGDIVGSAGAFTINGGKLDNTSGTAVTLTGTNATAINGDFTYLGGGAGNAHDLTIGTTGVVTLGGSGTRTITTTATNSTLTINGVVSNGATNGLTKTGAGKLALTNVNTYTGPTTINAGTLILSGSGSIGTGNLVMGGGKLDISAITASSYSLNSSQSISGNGTVTATGKTLTLNGAVDPNTTGLTIDGGTVALTSTTSFLYALGTSSDSISLTNSAVLSLGAGVIDFSDFTFSTTAGYGVGTYVLIGGASSVTGSLGSNLTGTVGGLNAALSLSSNNLVLNVTAVPEPATWALLGLGGMVGFFFRRRSA